MSVKIGHEKRRRMTAEQFADGLDAVGLTVEAFAWISGADPRRAARWWSGDDADIAPYVPLVLALLTLPGGPDMATKVARALTQPAEADRE